MRDATREDLLTTLEPVHRVPSYDEAVRALLSLGRELATPRQATVQKFGLGNITALANASETRSALAPRFTSPVQTAKAPRPQCSSPSCAPPACAPAYIRLRTSRVSTSAFASP